MAGRDFVKAKGGQGQTESAKAIYARILLMDKKDYLLWDCQLARSLDNY